MQDSYVGWAAAQYYYAEIYDCLHEEKQMTVTPKEAKGNLLKKVRDFFASNQDYVDSGQVLELLSELEKSLEECYVAMIASKELAFANRVEKLYKEWIREELEEDHEFEPARDYPYSNWGRLNPRQWHYGHMSLEYFLDDLICLGKTECKIPGFNDKAFKLHRYFCTEILQNDYPDEKDVAWFMKRVTGGPEYFYDFEDWADQVAEEMKQ